MLHRLIEAASEVGAGGGEGAAEKAPQTCTEQGFSRMLTRQQLAITTEKTGRSGKWVDQLSSLLFEDVTDQ